MLRCDNIGILFYYNSGMIFNDTGVGYEHIYLVFSRGYIAAELFFVQSIFNLKAAIT